MSGILPVGPGGGDGFDPNRRKSPEERWEDMKNRLRERILRSQRRFKEAMAKRLAANPPPIGKSMDTGTTFDSADVPDVPAPPAAGGDDRLDETA